MRAFQGPHPSSIDTATCWTRSAQPRTHRRSLDLRHSAARQSERSHGSLPSGQQRPHGPPTDANGTEPSLLPYG